MLCLTFRRPPPRAAPLPISRNITISTINTLLWPGFVPLAGKAHSLMSVSVSGAAAVIAARVLIKPLGLSRGLPPIKPTVSRASQSVRTSAHMSAGCAVRPAQNTNTKTL